MAQKLTTSARIGTGSINHNNRKFIAKNVDSSRTDQNIIFIQEDIKEVYHKLFDDALQEYNAKQTRKDRIIADYYEHIRLSKRLKLYHEVVFQLGDKDFKNKEILKSMLCEFMQDFQKNNPNLYVFNAVLHMDEATPHLHIDFVPVATKQKLGLHKKVSLKGALAEQGFHSKDRKHTEWQVWCDNQKQILGNIAISRGFEVEHKDVSRAHLNCDEYREQRQLVDKTKKEVGYYQTQMELAKANNIKYQEQLSKTQKTLEITQNQLSHLESELAIKNSDYNHLVNEVKTLSQQRNQLQLEVSRLSNELNRLNAENSQLVQDNVNNKNQILELQKQVDELSSQISNLEEEKNKILNPTQVDEFTITKKLFGGMTVKSKGNGGSVGMYLQQLVNMAKNYKSMENKRNIAISEKQKAVSERDTAINELQQFKEQAQRNQFNLVTNAKLQANNEHNQLNLLRRVCNIPKDIDTYDKLNHYLSRNNRNKNKSL